MAQKRGSSKDRNVQEKSAPAGGDRPLSGDADNRWSTTDENVRPRGVLVQEVMTAEVFTVPATSSANDAARIMRDNDLGFLPVVQADNSVVGVLTDRDLVVRLLAEDLETSTAVDELMSADLVTCHAGDDLAICEYLMRQNQLKRMVVLGDDDQLAGVVSLADLAQNEDESQVGAVVADVTGQAEPH